MDKVIKEMKDWCLENYENGADTMVECWDDEDYANLITESPSEEQAWDTLKSVASVYRERQADARYYKENC